MEDLLRYDCDTVYSQQETAGWFDKIASPLYNQAMDSFITIYSYQSPVDNLHYNMVAKISVADGSVEYLTSGEFQVYRIISYDEANHLVTFVATVPENPIESETLTVSDTPGSTPRCLTCGANDPSSGQPCKFNVAVPSPDGKHFVHFCNGPKRSGGSVRARKDFQPVLSSPDSTPKQEEYPVLYDRFPLPDGFTAYTKMLLPTNYDELSSYPVIVETYGGPGFQQVYTDNGDSWERGLVETHGLIYIFIDGRGTGFQSNEHMFQMFHGLGTVEIQDQIGVIQQLADKYAFLDMEQAGIWGWSYGGYATAMTMATDLTNVYKCGE